MIKLYIGDEFWKDFNFEPTPIANGVTIIQPDEEGDNRMWFRRMEGNKFKLSYLQLRYKDEKINDLINNIGGI